MRLNSIQGRLNAIALCFIVGTSVAVGIAGFKVTVNFENERFHEHFSLLASYLASNAELGVLLGNKKILESLTENMLTVSDVQVVEIFDQQGETIIRRAHGKAPSMLGSVSVPVVSEPMDSGDSPFLADGGGREVLGQVKISYSYAGLSQLKKLLALRFLLISLLLGLVPVVMYWRLSRAINAPLREILAVAGRVSQGSMDVRAKGGDLHETNTLATAINEMLDALALQRRKLDEVHAAMARQQALAEVGKFSMIVAHEIKNPLAIIKGSLDILKKDAPLEPGVRERLMGFLDEEIARINGLIEDFLVFARPQTPAFRVIAPEVLVVSLAERLKLMPEGAPVNFQLENPQSAPRGGQLRCDQQLLERALFNVVRNALEVSAADQEVRVAAVYSEGWLILTVEDNGPGVPSKELARIFEPFYSTKAKGTGLGLAIAKEIIVAHGGEISVVNRECGGACFTVSLPLEKAEFRSENSGFRIQK